MRTVCSGFVSSKNKQLSMRRCDGWGNKDNGGNSEAASLDAAPFLKKALWVLRHLIDQDSATQVPSPNVSEVTAVCCLRAVWEGHKRDLSIQVNVGSLLFYCWAFYSPWSATILNYSKYHGLYTLHHSTHVFFSHITPARLSQFPQIPDPPHVLFHS